MDTSSKSHDSFPEKPINNELMLGTSAVIIEELIQVTSPEVTEVASVIIEVLKADDENKDRLQDLWVEYAERVEAYVDSIKDPRARAEAQIAAIINKAVIVQFSGNTTR